MKIYNVLDKPDYLSAIGTHENRFYVAATYHNNVMIYHMNGNKCECIIKQEISYSDTAHVYKFYKAKNLFLLSTNYGTLIVDVNNNKFIHKTKKHKIILEDDRIDFDKIFINSAVSNNYLIFIKRSCSLTDTIISYLIAERAGDVYKAANNDDIMIFDRHNKTLSSLSIERYFKSDYNYFWRPVISDNEQTAAVAIANGMVFVFDLN